MKKYFFLLELLIALTIFATVIPTLLLPAASHLQAQKTTHQYIQEEILAEKTLAEIKERFFQDSYLLEQLKSNAYFSLHEEDAHIELRVEKASQDKGSLLIKFTASFPSENTFSRWFVTHEKKA